MRIFLPSVLVLVPSLLPAQRPDATFTWQKRECAITYGAVPVGKHDLGELAVGESWRLGFNEASTWQVGMPLLAGDAWIAPGQYRVTFVRDGEDSGSLVAAGCGNVLGSADARVAGEIARAGNASRKLQIEWSKDGKAEHGNQAANVVVQFGPSRWSGRVLALGHEAHKIAGGKLLTFHVPAERLEQGAVPAAVLLRGNDGDKGAWNLVLTPQKARLVPWMQAPTDDHGFGQVEPPDAACTTEGSVTELDGEAAAEAPVLTVRTVKLAGGELRLVAAYGKKQVEVVVPEPKATK